MGELAPWHIIIVVLLLVMLFGAKRLPGAAKSVGQSLKIFKDETKGLRGDKVEPHDAVATLPAAPAAVPVPAPVDIAPPETAPEPRLESGGFSYPAPVRGQDVPEHAVTVPPASPANPPSA